MVAAVLHSSVPTSSSSSLLLLLLLLLTVEAMENTQHLGELESRGGSGAWGEREGRACTGGLCVVGAIRVAGRPRLAPTCGEVCVRQSTEQMRALSPVIFHVFPVLNKTKAVLAESS